MYKKADSYPRNEKLGSWLALASREAKNFLMEKAGASDIMTRQWVTGRRAMSAEKAGVVEKAMSEIQATVQPSLPGLRRGDLCGACKSCSYYNSEQKAEEWPYLEEL